MARFTRKNQGSSHSYYLDGDRIPGVTTVIGILDKPALVGWAARETAIYADENWDRLAAMRSGDRIQALEKARFNTNRKAVVKGNRIHNLGEQLAHGKTVEVPLEIRSQVEAYARFLDSWDLQVVATETPVCSTEWAYGGTFDLIAESPRFGRALMDIKTGKGVYDEVALQLNAYAACDLRLVAAEVVGPRGGVKVEWHEAPMVDVECLRVAHVLEDTVEMVPVQMDASIGETFLHMLEIFESWTKRVGWDYRDDESYDPPVGKPIWPEDAPAAVTP
jgi:hypothetical protein